MKLFFLTFSLIIIGCTTRAQSVYDVSLISKDLLPYASAVVRDREETVEVKSLDNAILHVKAVITVFNKNGDDFARIHLEYDKHNSINYVKGVIYDALGKQTGKFSEKDFEDVSAINDFSLFEDSRVKYYTPIVINYPYTIKYEYETQSKQTLCFNDWEPNSNDGIAIEESTFTFISKPDFNIRYKETNLPDKVVIANDKGLKTYTWQISNLKALKAEPYSPNPYTYIANVKIAPENFTYDEIKGSFTNWNELGKWEYNNLLLNRDQLPGETIDYIKNLTKDIADPKQKARKIYEYMQQKTHYVSVQIGIGGYQPFKADEVDKLSYGDCKALVNYTQALLKVANIESYYCVVTAGKSKTSMFNDFPSMDQGNHVILCLPFKNDTTWLECTSQKIPFGFLGDFTDDRTVLACTPQGGILLHTPKYAAQNNSQIRKVNFTLNEGGELSGTMETIFKGLQYDNREEIISSAQTEQVKELKKIYPINNMNIEAFNFKQDKSLQPITIEDLKLTARDYAANTDNKIYFMLNPANRIINPPLRLRNRLNDVYIKEGYIDEDEIIYTIPKGYKLEKEALAVNINKPFGNYTASMDLKGDKLIYKRKMQLLDGTYSKDTYQDLVDFYQDVVDADAYSVTLVKAAN